MWLRKPFFHVLWIGALLCAGYRLQGAAPGLYSHEAENRSRASTPGRVSFRQVYFPFNGRSPLKDATRAQHKLASNPDSSKATERANHAQFSAFYGDRTPEQVAAVFGPNFAYSVFRLKRGSWQGPIKSDHGWHVVWVDSIQTAGPE